eukprot:7616805-Pyramimonas_sp.AAC.1
MPTWQLQFAVLPATAPVCLTRARMVASRVVARAGCRAPWPRARVRRKGEASSLTRSCNAQARGKRGDAAARQPGTQTPRALGKRCTMRRARESRIAN